MPGVVRDDEGNVFGAPAGSRTAETMELDQDGLLDFDAEREKAKDMQQSFIRAYYDFICHFKDRTNSGKNEQYVYRVQLQANVKARKNFLEVDMRDLRDFRRELAQEIEREPLVQVPYFEEAATMMVEEYQWFTGRQGKAVQVLLFKSIAEPQEIRSVVAGDNRIGSLIAVTGIVVRAYERRPKIVSASLQCSDCKNETTIQVPSNSFSPQLPKQCIANSSGPTEKCRANPYIVRPNKSLFVDTQRLKLQENREKMPPGEIPRHMDITVDRHLVDVVKPGTRVVLLAVNQIYHDAVKEKGRKAAGIRKRYLRALGILELHGLESNGNAICGSLMQEGKWKGKSGQDYGFEATMKKLRERKSLVDDLARSLAPTVIGHHEIKKAIIAQLLGGVLKKGDGVRIRGDINILLVGDPSTAKSMLLKCAHDAAPVSEYTSGKGSSAAGLTAAVCRESGKNKGSSAGGFYLEGGSMVLADGGLICIDEFDKMRSQDAVAIHEAMEQQTISIAKAGLNCVLNARTSVLAAANPISGVYDATKGDDDQMSFKASVLSRFDLIFKVLDTPGSDKDRTIARGVFRNHGGVKVEAPAKEKVEEGDIIPIQTIRDFIRHVRAFSMPKLGQQAADRLLNFYVEELTKSWQNLGGAAGDGGQLQLTTRQLESLIRISEAFAKAGGDLTVREDHTQMATQLLKLSTVQAMSGDVAIDPHEQEREVGLILDELPRLIPLGKSVRTEAVRFQLKQRFKPALIDKGLLVMVKKGELVFERHQTYLRRKRA